MSAYKIETWLKRGFSYEDAKYQIAIRRPSTVAYYQHKFGVSEEEAYRLRLEHQIKTSEKRRNLPVEKQREYSPRCVEYWLLKGHSQEEAERKVSEFQTTFSLQLCIEKHGVEKGTQIWSTRQSNWQATLNKKPPEEKKTITAKKNTKKIKQFILKYGEEKGREKFIESLKNSKCSVLLSLQEIETFIKNQHTPFDVYLPYDVFIKKYIPDYFWELVDKPTDVHAWLNSIIDFKSPCGEIIFKGSSQHGIKRAHYNMYVGKKLLRSSNEIYFFHLLKECGFEPGIDFLIEKYYYNTKYRCDFYLIKGNAYIELAGYGSETYRQHMLYKHATFGSIILEDQSSYKNYILKYKKTFYENNGR